MCAYHTQPIPMIVRRCHRLVEARVSAMRIAPVAVLQDTDTQPTYNACLSRPCARETEREGEREGKREGDLHRRRGEKKKGCGVARHPAIQVD